MCGLVGVLGEPGVQAQYMFEDMLQMDVIRGPHSTGVCAVSEKNVYINKGLVLPTELIQSDRYIRNVDKKFGEIFAYIGHNRWATMGKVTKRNAHPFQHGHITLVHNGTLDWIPFEKYEDGTHVDFDTDSEMICWMICHYGIEYAYKECSGAMNLVWWDSKEKTLNMISNGERPLTLAYTEDQSMLLWASERWMIEGAAERRALKLASDRFFRPKKHQMFTCSYDTDLNLVSVESRALEPYSYIFGKGNANQNRWSGAYGLEDDWDFDGAAYGSWSAYQAGENDPTPTWEDAANEQARAAITVQRKEESGDKSIKDKLHNLISLDTHRLNHATNQYEPKATAGDALGPYRVQILGQDVEDDEEIDLLRRYKKNSMSAAEFEKKYPTCYGCRESMKGEFDDSVIVDNNAALCGSCAEQCTNERMDVRSLIGGGI